MLMSSRGMINRVPYIVDEDEREARQSLDLLFCLSNQYPFLRRFETEFVWGLGGLRLDLEKEMVPCRAVTRTWWVRRRDGNR